MTSKKSEETTNFGRPMSPVLPRVFNPRIRIIGVPTASLPSALRHRVPDHVRWEDAGEAASVDPIDVFRPLQADSQRQPAEVEPAQSQPAQSQPVQAEPTQAELDAEAPVSVRAIMDVGAVLPFPSAAVVASCDPPATEVEAEVPRASDSQVVTSAPELPLSPLAWDEREQTETMDPFEDMAAVWGDDEVTMPHHRDGLHALAHRSDEVETLPQLSAAREAELAAALAAWESEAAGPHGTLVDGAASAAAEQEAISVAERVVAIGRSRDGADGDTLVDDEADEAADPLEDPAELYDALVDARSETASTDGESLEEPEPASSTRRTLRSSRPPAFGFDSRSIEIDLAELDAPRPSAPVLALVASATDVPTDGEASVASEALPLVVVDNAADEHTPAPRALRSVSVAPASNHSFPPVALPEESPPTRVSSARPSRRRAGPWVAAVVVLCAAVAAFVLYPRNGMLVIRIDSPEGAVAKAEIFVDGTKRCDTDPCIVRGMVPGEHVVKVVVPGRDAPAIAAVTVAARKQAEVTVSLPAVPAAPEAPAAAAEPAPKPGLEVEVVTEGARVVLVHDRSTEVLAGPWPRTVALAPGRYKLVASRYGFAPFSRWLTVAADRGPIAVRIDLEPEEAAAPSPEPAPPAAASAEPAEAPVAPPASSVPTDIYE